MTRLYQICVGHQLDESWNEWFDGLTVTSKPDGSSLLIGILDDPSTLHSVLDKIRNLNLDLVSVSYTEVLAEKNDD